jgi:hypothetical protein
MLALSGIFQRAGQNHAYTKQDNDGLETDKYGPIHNRKFSCALAIQYSEVLLNQLTVLSAL